MARNKKTKRFGCAVKYDRCDLTLSSLRLLPRGWPHADGTATTLPMSPIFHGISALSRKSPRSDFVVSESINKMAGFTSAEGPRGVQLSILHPWTGLPPLRPRIIYIYNIYAKKSRKIGSLVRRMFYRQCARRRRNIFRKFSAPIRNTAYVASRQCCRKS